MKNTCAICGNKIEGLTIDDKVCIFCALDIASKTLTLLSDKGEKAKNFGHLKTGWAVFIKPIKGQEKYSGSCFTWDKKHPEDKRPEKSVKVFAIYPRKKDAINHARFIGGAYVVKIFI